MRHASLKAWSTTQLIDRFLHHQLTSKYRCRRVWMPKSRMAWTTGPGLDGPGLGDSAGDSAGEIVDARDEVLKFEAFLSLVIGQRSLVKESLCG